MHLRYHRRAREELRQAAVWYERQQPGLSARFLDAFNVTLSRILNDPESYAIVRADGRLAVLKSFPYGIVYRIAGDTIYIDSIRHHSRHPRFGFGRK